MPIRINLLAEAQAQEEMRRRDPVKRAIVVGVILVAVMLVLSAYLGFKGAAYKSELASSENLLESNSKAHQQVLNNQKQSADLGAKLTALQNLSTSRFLVANLLNALQQTTMDEIQLTRLRLDQSLTFNGEITANLSAKRAAKPASVTERTLLLLDVRDSCSKPGDLIPKFQQFITDAPYFAAMLDKNDPQRVHLKEGSYGPVQSGPDGRQYQPFTLECRFPEKTR